tara:strand:+ start:7106 stop:7327 length:222 start_codon:yes stop_codon:yes gene_type:complete
MRYKLICNDRCYPDQDFTSLKEARSWLYQHGRYQLDVQGDLRDPKNVGHEIDLRSTWTYGIAEYFDFELTKNK